VALAQLDTDGIPDVDVTLYTGGAHCCFVSSLYLSEHHASSYERRTKQWGDPLPTLIDLGSDGISELKSLDDRFAYAFTDYAESAMPVQIWSYANGRTNDITRRFPALVEKDAQAQWQAYLRARSHKDSSMRGILAAYLADEYLLGEQDTGWKRVDAARTYLAHGFNTPGTVDAYLALLRKDLNAWGY
jgi:hypothetical protein